MSRVPWQLPNQRGTEVFPATTRVPVKTVVVVPPGADPDASRKVYERSQAVINKFYLKAAQAHALGIVDVSASHMELPGLKLRYANQQGVEHVFVEVTAIIPKPKPEKISKPELPWDWIIVEIVARDLSDDGEGAPYRLDTRATRIRPDRNDGAIYPINSLNAQSDGADPPMLDYAFATGTTLTPAAGICLTSMRADLRDIFEGGMSLEIDIDGKLAGGHINLPRWSKPISGTTTSQTSTTIVILDQPTEEEALVFWPYPLDTGSRVYAPGSPILSFVNDGSGQNSSVPYNPGEVGLRASITVDGALPPLVPQTSVTTDRTHYVESLTLHPASGLPLEYVHHFMSLVAIGGNPHNTAVRDIRRTITFPTPTFSYDVVPQSYSRGLECFWVAGFGEPPADAKRFLANNRTYYQWLQDADPLTFFGTIQLDFAPVVTNAGNYEPVGTLQVDRYMHTVVIDTQS